MSKGIVTFQGFKGLRIDNGMPHNIEAILGFSIISLEIDGERQTMSFVDTAERPVGNIFVGNVAQSTRNDNNLRLVYFISSPQVNKTEKLSVLRKS